MKKLKQFHKILNELKSKSNIDYIYYHLFDNKEINLNYDLHNFTINYIIYIINSDFSYFKNKYKSIKDEFITDLFLERLKLDFEDKKFLFSMVFKNLFWLKINNIKFLQKDYLWIVNFLVLNKLDINRIFFENTWMIIF